MITPLALYKALAEETRLKSLLLMQSQGEICVCDLMQGLELSQPKVSRHLAELRKHNLVLAQRRGKWVHYQINPDLPQWINEILSITLTNNSSLIEKELKNITVECCSSSS